MLEGGSHQARSGMSLGVGEGQWEPHPGAEGRPTLPYSPPCSSTTLIEGMNSTCGERRGMCVVTPTPYSQGEEIWDPSQVSAPPRQRTSLLTLCLPAKNPMGRMKCSVGKTQNTQRRAPSVPGSWKEPW